MRGRRVSLGLSQAELAKSLGITFQQLQKYESGANRISASRLFDLSRALEVSISFFFEEGTPGRLAAAKESFDEDVLQLVHAYHDISDPVLRRFVRELLTYLGRKFRSTDRPAETHEQK